MFELFTKHEYPSVSPRNRRWLFAMLVATAVVNSATMGYDTMMMSSLIAIDPFTDYFNLDAATTGLLNAAMWMGSILSVLVITYSCDHYGRKLTILIYSLVCIIGVILQSAAQNIGMFVVARMIIGFGCQVTGSAAPLLITETVPAKFRGTLVGIYFTMFNAGAIIASGITYGTGRMVSTWSWRLPALLQSIPSVVAIVILPLVPESPRWLLVKGYHDYAIEVIQIAYIMSPGEAERKASMILDKFDTETPFKGQFKRLFSWTRPMLRRLLIILSFAWILEMGGSSVGSYYFTVVLTQAGITSNEKLLEFNMISSCWNFAVSIGGALFFDTIGRKRQAVISLAGMVVCFFALGGFINKWGQNTVNRSAQYATLFWMFLFNGFYNFCYTPLNTLYPSEIFPTNIRAAGMTFFQFWNSGFGLLAAFILPIAMDAVGWKFYMINAGYNILFFPIIHYVWVEMKGIGLEQIAMLFGDDVKKDIESGNIESVSVTEKKSLDNKEA